MTLVKDLPEPIRSRFIEAFERVQNALAAAEREGDSRTDATMQSVLAAAGNYADVANELSQLGEV